MRPKRETQKYSLSLEELEQRRNKLTEFLLDQTVHREEYQFQLQRLKEERVRLMGDGVSLRYGLKKPFGDFAKRLENENWRPHGDSNPGYYRERVMS